MIPPGDDGLGPSGLEARVPERLEAFLESIPRQQKKLVPMALWAVELYPLGLGPFPRVFTSLSKVERRRVFVRLERHRIYPLRGAYAALKLLSFMFWGEDPVVARFSGWGAPSA